MQRGGVGEEPGGVVGRGAGEDVGRRSGLDDAACAHDDDLVGPLTGDREIVGDEEDAHARVRAQLVEEVEYALLHRDIEGRGRLVGDEQPGPQRDRRRDEHPLAHAPGELVRVLVGAQLRPVDADTFEEVDDLGAGGTAVGPLVDAQRLGDGRPHGLQRVERVPGILRHIPDLRPAHPAPALPGQRREIDIAEADPP